MSRDGWAALPRGATGLSAVCDCGISWSYLLTIFGCSTCCTIRTSDCQSIQWRNFTHWSWMDFPTIIPSLSVGRPHIQYQGRLVVFFSLSNSKRTYCKQTVKIQIRRRTMRRLIWVRTICLCHIQRTLCLYGSKSETDLCPPPLNVCIWIYEYHEMDP